MIRALEIDQKSYGKEHPNVARDLNNLALLLQATTRLEQAESLMRSALEIDEKSYGKEHPEVATDLNNLARLLHATDRREEAEPLMGRVVEIYVQFTRATGHKHPHLMAAVNNYGGLLMDMGWSREEAVAEILKIVPPEVFQ